MMEELFATARIIPTPASLEFAAQCVGESWLPELKLVVPAVYYITLPFTMVFGTFMLSALVVYLLIPVAGRFGVYFKDTDQKKAAVGMPSATTS